MLQDTDSETCRALKEKSEPPIWIKHDIKSKKTQSSFSSQSQPKWLGLAELIPHVSRKGADIPPSSSCCKQAVHIYPVTGMHKTSTDFPLRILTTLTPPTADRKSEAINTANWYMEIIIGSSGKSIQTPTPKQEFNWRSRANSFCIFQKGVCVCIHTHTYTHTPMCAQLL